MFEMVHSRPRRLWRHLAQDVRGGLLDRVDGGVSGEIAVDDDLRPAKRRGVVPRVPGLGQLPPSVSRRLQCQPVIGVTV